MKYTAWAWSGFQTNSDWRKFGTETVRGGLGGPTGRVQVGSVRGGSGQEFSNSCGCAAGLNFAGRERARYLKFLRGGNGQKFWTRAGL